MSALHLTYELYVRAEDADEPQFEALTAPSDVEAMATVRRMINDRGLGSVEVRRMGAHLFTLTA